MISIAIIAIVFGVATSSYLEFCALQRQIEYRDSLDQSSWQLEALRAEDFDSLPPETGAVDASGDLRLHQSAVDESTLSVSDLATGAPITGWTFDAGSSTLHLKQARRGRVLVNYQFILPSRGNTYFADASSVVKLSISRGTKIQRIYVAGGESLKAVTDYHREGDQLQLPSAMAGKLVVLDTINAEEGNRVSGVFVDDRFARTSKASSTKLLRVQEPSKGGGQMALTLIKERR